MLYKGSLLNVDDNSGALVLKILSFKTNKRRKFCTLFDIVYCVTTLVDPNRKLPKKEFIDVLILTQPKKFTKGNGLFFTLNTSYGIPLVITRFIKPLATRVEMISFFELKYRKKFDVIFKSLVKYY
jgi:ribosomal protein L14